jgi:hypothetical protein
MLAPIPKNSSSNLASATSLEDLYACIPRSFVAFFRTNLRTTHDIATKLSHAEQAVKMLQSHWDKSTFPPNIQGSLKTPSVQVSKEFASSSEHQAFLGEFAIKLQAARRSHLELCIQTKSAEEAKLRALIDSDVLLATCSKVINEAKSVLDSALSNVGSSFLQQDLDVCQKEGVSWFRKAIIIAFSRHHRELIAKMSKLSIKTDTDVEMRDLSANDIKSTIDRAVAEALRKAGHRGVFPNKKGTAFSPMKRKAANSLSPSQKRQKPSFAAKEEGSQFSSEQSDQGRQNPSQAQGFRGRKRERIEEAQEGLARIDSELDRERFKPSDLSTFPPTFFSENVHTRARWLFLHSSTSFVDSLSAYKGEIFLGPGVSVPEDVQMTLALNGKFVLHSPMKKVLVPRAIVQLMQAVRTRYEFRDRPINPAYIAEFHVKKDDWIPPLASDLIENTLIKVKDCLLRQIKSLPNIGFRYNPNVSNVRSFLDEKKYLVKITDKNLGLSVISLSWYLDQCKTHLSNSIAYRKEMINLSQLQKDLDLIAESATLPAAIRKYLKTSENKLPRFHVIPKVHKTPWSSRPIVPSHSWITSKASEVVDYCLKPLLSKYPMVLDSTKSFLERISTIKDVSNCWLVTGDVTAMYTNINPFKAIEVIGTMLSRENRRVRKKDLLELIQFVLLNNFFEFQGTTFCQTSGLAMGTACAPTIANLYCADYEKKRLWTHTKVKAYGRYIDDIFFIFQGSENELHEFLSHWKLPGLDITWQWSQSKTVFLDVELSIEKGRLVTRLFQKILNKHLYIPFSSAHPLSVKKAFVKAERIRYRMICSEAEDWTSAEHRLRANLLRRGYPNRLLERWFNDDLRPVVRPVPKIILSSEYNPVWEFIKMGPIREILSQCESADFNELDSLVLSLKRGLNMSDIYNMNNMTILNSLVGE